MSVPDLVQRIDAALSALAAQLPAGWRLGWEIPHDAAADAMLKARRYHKPQRALRRLGLTLPDALGAGPHVLIELVAPSGRVRYAWVDSAADLRALVVALRTRIAAQGNPTETELPDGTTAVAPGDGD